MRAGIRSLLEKIPNVEIVGEVGDGQEAIRLVEKHEPDVVLLAIQVVARGDIYLSPPILKPVILEYSQPTNVSLGQIKGLSPRQTQVLQLIAKGKTTKQVALELNISVKTVETHRIQLMDRLEIHDIPGLVRFAIKVGLVELED